jgi:ribosomal protein L23
VYLLPNPTEIRTPDFILEKKRVFRIYDLKTVYGKSSISDSLIDSIGQCNRILINMTRDYNTRSLAYAIKSYFEINSQAVEVLIFKGGKRISVMRHMTIGEAFFHMFKKAYER